MEVTLKNVRLAFADIWTARPPRDGKGESKYGATFILDPKANKEAIKEINAAIKKVAKEKWGAKSDRILATLEGDAQKFCYFEEDNLNEEGDVQDGFEGMYYLRSKSGAQPTLLDRDRTELTKSDGKPYAGCFVVAKVDIWAQDNVHGKGLRCQVKGIQFFKDGDAFGGGQKSKVDDFEDLSDLGDEDEAPAKGRRAAVDDEDETPVKAKPKRKPAPADDEDDFA